MDSCLPAPASDLPLSDSGVKVDTGESGRRVSDPAPAWQESAFMKACRGERVDYTPVWLMRQAGRFAPEYRAVRSKVGFLELCKRPDLAAEVTVTAVETLGVDAAIIFADLLLPLEPMGVGLEYAPGDGPIIHRPVRTGDDVDRLPEVDVEGALAYVGEAVSIARKGLNPGIPLIGFAGAPFTLASYLIEGGGSRHYENTKTLMYREPASWHKLMEKLAGITARFLSVQVAAGAQAVQLFDSWVGCLSCEDYREYVLPHSRQAVAAVSPAVPLIHFGTGTPHLLALMREAGGDVIGLDWRVALDQGWQIVGHDVGVQGNLDPVVLLSEPSEIRRRAARILEQAGGRSGHIFNLGHGVLPSTPYEHVKFLVETVHEISSR